jgi:hypothetical protein
MLLVWNLDVEITLIFYVCFSSAFDVTNSLRFVAPSDSHSHCQNKYYITIEAYVIA